MVSIICRDSHVLLTSFHWHCVIHPFHSQIPSTQGYYEAWDRSCFVQNVNNRDLDHISPYPYLLTFCKASRSCAPLPRRLHTIHSRQIAVDPQSLTLASIFHLVTLGRSLGLLFWTIGVPFLNQISLSSSYNHRSQQTTPSSRWRRHNIHHSRSKGTAHRR